MIPNDRRLRQFACILAGILIALGGLSWHKHAQDGVVFFSFYFGSAGLILLVSFVRPRALVPVEKMFIQVGEVLGFFVTRLVLGLVFFFILTPIGIFFKLNGRPSPFQKIDKSAPSYWEKTQNSPPERFKRQF